MRTLIFPIYIEAINATKQTKQNKMTAQNLIELDRTSVFVRKAFETLCAANAVEAAWSAYVRDEATQISKAEAAEIAEARAAVEAAELAYAEAKSELYSN